jgi:hypothetical protein
VYLHIELRSPFEDAGFELIPVAPVLHAL